MLRKLHSLKFPDSNQDNWVSGTALRESKLCPGLALAKPTAESRRERSRGNCLALVEV